MEYYKRLLKIQLPHKQSAFLWGARKTGKSTFLTHHFSTSASFDLLDTNLFLSYSKRPSLFREHVLSLSEKQLLLPIIIDEAQKIPLLFDEVHFLIEKYDLSFILCGSSARKLKRGQANLLGGRAWRYEMLPLCYLEVPNFDLIKALNTGLIPSHYLGPDPKRSLEAYISNYLNEEIKAEGLTRNISAFAQFLEAVGFTNAELVNYTNIARECGIDAKTVKAYFQILEDTHLGYFLEPYIKHRSRQIISSTPKFYLFDIGVGTALSENHFSSIKGSAAGKAFEHFIFLELKAFQSYMNVNFTINYWKTKTGIEVDFILSTKEKIIAIEVKIKSSIARKDFQGLLRFGESHHAAEYIIVCLEERPRHIEISSDITIKIIHWETFIKNLWNAQYFS